MPKLGDVMCSITALLTEAAAFGSDQRVMAIERHNKAAGEPIAPNSNVSQRLNKVWGRNCVLKMGLMGEASSPDERWVFIFSPWRNHLCAVITERSHHTSSPLHIPQRGTEVYPLLITEINLWSQCFKLAIPLISKVVFQQLLPFSITASHLQ